MASLGRPTKYCKELADEICQKISDGESLRSICRDDSMPHKSNVFVWLKKYPDFQDQYRRAREDQAESLFDEMLDIADDSVNDYMATDEGFDKVNQENIQRSRLRIEARKWMLGKMKPKKYGDKVDLDIKADLNHSYEITTRDKVDQDDIGYTES